MCGRPLRVKADLQLSHREHGCIHVTFPLTAMLYETIILRDGAPN